MVIRIKFCSRCLSADCEPKNNIRYIKLVIILSKNDECVLLYMYSPASVRCLPRTENVTKICWWVCPANCIWTHGVCSGFFTISSHWSRLTSFLQQLGVLCMHYANFLAGTIFNICIAWMPAACLAEMLSRFTNCSAVQSYGVIQLVVCLIMASHVLANVSDVVWEWAHL